MKSISDTPRKAESEKALEARLVSEVRKRDGIAIKLTSQFHRGLPDRLIVLPFHTLIFVELKSTGKKPTLLQENAMAQLRAMRFTCRVVDSTETLDEVLAMIDARLEEQKQISATLFQKKHELSRAYHREIQSKSISEKMIRKIVTEDINRLSDKFDNEYKG